jgi:hypothetical protein
MLNDVNSRYLPVQEARFFRRADLQTLLDVPKTVVVKDAVQLVVTDAVERSEEQLFFATVKQKTHQDAAVALPSAMIEGTLHVKMARDPHAFLSVEATRFFPLTNATIHQLTADAKSLESAVVFIRTEAVAAMTFRDGQ